MTRAVHKAALCLFASILIIGLGSGLRLSLPAGSAPEKASGAGAGSGSPARLESQTAQAAHAAEGADEERYPYRSERFAELAAESYRQCTGRESHDFYQRVNEAYERCDARFAGKESLGLTELLGAQKRELSSIASISEEKEAEIVLLPWVHKLVKAIAPRFSLDRGFELYDVVEHGERQCFSQSVLIASLLQEMGVDAGVVMVYRNVEGKEINNGHAVVLVKLPDGEDILVDASHREPFVRQKGLLVRAPGYRYVNAIYEEHTSEIRGYESARGKAAVADRLVRALDFHFIRSQFWYYRGERAKDGILSERKTRQGLAASRQCLQTSVRLCPDNALSVYMLGRVYLLEGRVALARNLLETAYRLYSRCGWIPEGPRRYLALAKRAGDSGAL
jgi:hypothetical protein